MGNYSSNSIKIILNCNCYYSGDTIKGSLIVLSHKVKNNLFLQFKGKEQINFKSNGKNESHIFFTLKTHIHTFTEEDPTIPLVFPFEIKLNQLLPSSFHYKNNHLMYILSAQLTGIQKIKQIVKIKESKVKIQQEMQLHTVDGKLYQCRMIYKGKMRLQCKLLGNQFIFGDKIEVLIQMNNDDCDDSINSIQVKLVNIITIRSKSQGEYTKITNLSIQQIQASTDQFKSVKINLYFPQQQLFPTINGELISNSYKIIITPIISEIELLDKTPILDIPIEIIAGKINGQQKIGQDISYLNQLIMPISQLDVNQINYK